MRQLTNGDVVFPCRGNPPGNPNEDKYVRDLGDPYLFHLRLPDCIHRETVNKIIPKCKKVIFVNRCKQNGEIVDYVDCSLCTLDKTK